MKTTGRRDGGLVARRFALGILLTAAQASSGCGPALLCPERGGAAWRELRTPHFVVRTDLDAKDARALATDFEERFHVLTRAVFTASRPIEERAEVIAFASGRQLRAVAPKDGVVAFVRPAEAVRALPGPTIVLAAERDPFGPILDEETRALVSSILTRWILFHYVPQAPRWLREGLAHYCQTMDISGDRVVVGRPIWSTLSTAVSLPRVSQILTAGPEAFRAADRNKSLSYQAGAWLLVHVLASDQGSRFGAYLNGLARAGAPQEAWSAAFGGFDPDRLENSYRARARAATVPGRILPIPQALGAPLIEEAPMSHRDVHLLWARLHGDRPERAEAALAELAADGANDAEVLFERALIEVRRKRRPEALELARRAAALAPDQRNLALLGTLLMPKLVPAVANPAPLEPELAQIIERLTPVATASGPLAVLARAHLVAGRDVEARGYAERAVTAAPTCWRCQFLLALVRLRCGDLAGARGSIERAWGLLTDDVPVRHVNAVFAQRALLQQMKPGDSVASVPDGAQSADF